MSFTDSNIKTGPIASRAIDIVAIYRTDSGEQVFTDARPVDASVYEAADAMRHPLEDGSSIVDHLVYQPVEIEFRLRVTTPDPATVYAEIRDLFRAGEVLSVQTRAATYESMFITGLPHEERVDQGESLNIDLRLVEAVFLKSEYGGAVAPIRSGQVTPPGAPRNQATRRAQSRTSTTQRGNQQTTAPTTAQQSQGSTLYRLFGR